VCAREIADGSEHRGLYTSLASTPSNVPHISYYDNTTGAWYAKKPGVWTRSWWMAWTLTWGIEHFDPARCLGNPRISYYDFTNQDLKYAHRSAACGTKEVVDGSATTPASSRRWPSTLGRPCICYSTPRRASHVRAQEAA
jgi:hypothetical protein